MRPRSTRCPRSTRWLSVLLALALFAPLAAQAADDVCQGFEKSSRIARLGRHTISAKPVSGPAQLAALMEEHKAELHSMLEARGMGHLTDRIIHAVASGEGLSERNLSRGEVFEWMIFRKRGKVSSEGPLCFASKKTYSAYQVEITETGGDSYGGPTCELEASGDCAGKTLSADASGSSLGVEVTLSGPGGSQTIISGDGPKTWSGPYENRFRSTYTFTARATVRAKENVTTYTFIIPKVCLNLALVGKETTTVESEPKSCEETVKVDPCPAPPPSCSLTVTPSEVWAGQETEVAVSGHWDRESSPQGISVAVSDGQSLSGPFPTPVRLEKPGTVELTGTATNEVGETATCEATVEVKPRWTARFFGAYVTPNGDDETASAVVNGVPEVTDFRLSDGVGFGAGLEYRATDLVGIEAAVLDAGIDSIFLLDTPTAWLHDTDDLGLLALTVGANFHLTQGKRADFYLGPFIGYGTLDDGEYNFGGDVRTVDDESEFVWGGQLGLDIPFNPRWAVHFGVLYMDIGDLQPLVGTAGFAVRF